MNKNICLHKPLRGVGTKVCLVKLPASRGSALLLPGYSPSRGPWRPFLLSVVSWNAGPSLTPSPSIHFRPPLRYYPVFICLLYLKLCFSTCLVCFLRPKPRRAGTWSVTATIHPAWTADSQGAAWLDGSSSERALPTLLKTSETWLLGSWSMPVTIYFFILPVDLIFKQAFRTRLD